VDGVEFVQRPHRARLAADLQAGHEDHHARQPRPVSEGELSGFGRFADVDLAIAGDGEASLPLLTERIRQRVDAGRRSAFEARGSKLAQAQRASLEQAKSQATIAWDASPITTAAPCAPSSGPDRGQDCRSSVTASA